MDHKIIIYFSYTNHTRMIANRIKEKLGCDILEIKTVTPYSDNYDSVVNDDKNSESSNYLPDLQDITIDLNQYDTIILGTPVWWYRPVPAIRSFLTNYDLKEKKVIPFATNAGWLGRTFDEIKKLCPNSNIEKEMNIVFKSYSDTLVTNKEEIDKWINTI